MRDEKKRFVIAGGGGFGREVAAWLLACGIQAEGFIDDTLEKGSLNGIRPVLGSIVDFEPVERQVVLIAIAKPLDREGVARILQEKKVQFTTMGCHSIHSTRATWGQGTILCPHSVLSENARVGQHVHVNMGSLVGHDAIVSDFCTISCQCDIMGGAILGERVFMGSGARIFPGVKVGADAIIGAGAVVVNDVPEGVTVYSQPARQL